MRWDFQVRILVHLKVKLGNNVCIYEYNSNLLHNDGSQQNAVQ